MELVEKFKEIVGKENLFSPNDLLLLAVSGGMDSSVLCELCHQAGYRFVIAHVNFGLRGPESDRDEDFVKALGMKYDVTVWVKRVDTEAYIAEKKVSVQVAARELRYQWFDELLSGSGGGEAPCWLLTAHHADDNVETMLMHFFRGSGISGLRGMLPKQDRLVRPLLTFTSAMLLDFANQRELSWVEDSSNASEKYTRNYFRHTLIPLVNKIFPEAENNLRENIRRFREVELLYQQAIQLHARKLLKTVGDEIRLPALALKKLTPLNSIVYEIVKPFHFTPQQVGDIIHLLEGGQAKYVQSPSHRIIRNRKQLVIAPLRSAEPQHILIEAGEPLVESGDWSLTIAELALPEIKIPNDPGTACLDLKKIAYPLLLRQWKQGDYFYPLGMRKKKKIARFLIDCKLSPTEKEKVWVLESGKKIAWVVGMRIDDRFKVSAHTKKVLRINFKKKI
ncbi:MAG: tRNA lysidine(34) synthetase TilS [Chitinophagaceae bacterium]|nr:tRNA lysidine(34) synthetase TilS [Chitinophagaceae bacterium]